MTRKIAIVRAGALGDTILTIPALVLLRQRYPNASFTAIGYPDTWAVAGSLVDEVIFIDDARLRDLLWTAPEDELQRPVDAERAGVAASASKNRQELAFDLTVAWTSRPLHGALGRTNLIQASPYPPPGMHAAAWLLRTVGLPDDAASIEGALASWRSALGLGGAEEEDRIVIHPGAGAAWKRWPAERFAAVANGLAERGCRIEVIEGPADREAVEAMGIHAQRPLSIVRGLSLIELSRHLARAALYIGNDSGVTHLAGAAGAPVLALFGPTDPVSWAPLGQSRVMRDCGAPATYQGQIRVCHDPACMSPLSADEVLEAALEGAMQTRGNGDSGIRHRDYAERPRVPLLRRDR